MLGRQHLHVLLVHPHQLLGVEGRRGLRDVLHVEELNHLVKCEDLLIAVAPAEADEVVDECLGEIAVIAVLHYAHRTVALRELGAVVAEDHRDVCELGDREAQRLVDVDLARGVVDVVLAAYDVGDAHVGVIDDDAEVVGRGSVGAADDEVIKLAVRNLDVAADEVVELHGALGRVPEPYDIRLVRGVLGVIVAAVAVIAGLLALFELLLAERVNALLGAVALVGKALREHVVDNRVVAVKALRLIVRALVPVKAQPLHRLDDGVSSLLG